jgi:hypothetical protein
MAIKPTHRPPTPVAPIQKAQGPTYTPTPTNPGISSIINKEYPGSPSTFLRSPIPPIGLAPSDNLRQYYNQGMTPQYRAQVLNIFSNPFGVSSNTSTSQSGINTSKGGFSSTAADGNTTTYTNGSDGTITATITSPTGRIIRRNTLSTVGAAGVVSSIPSTSGSGSSGSTPSGTAGRVFTASMTTPVLNQNQSYAGTITLAKSYVILTVAVTNAARVRVYSTQNAMSRDLGRLSTSPVILGLENEIVGEWLLLQQSEFVWSCSPAPVGYNADQPASTTAYVSVSNPNPSSNTIQVSLTYVSLEN